MNRSKKYFAKELWPLPKSISLAVLCLLSACAPLTPHWDARFGDAVRMAIAQQTINPEASRNVDPVNGIDGRAAGEAMNRYHESFQKPPPPPPQLIITNR